MPFSCTFAGTCEDDRYQTRIQCEAECSSVEFKDLLYEVYGLMLEEVIHLAPSDQRQVLYRLVGESGGDHPDELLEALIQQDLVGVYQVALRLNSEPLREYVRQRLSPEADGLLEIMGPELLFTDPETLVDRIREVFPQEDRILNPPEDRVDYYRKLAYLIGGRGDLEDLLASRMEEIIQLIGPPVQLAYFESVWNGEVARPPHVYDYLWEEPPDQPYEYYGYN